MKDFWYDKVEVSIFLCSKGSDTPSCGSQAVTKAQRDQIEADLESLRPLVQEVFYESKADAYARFQEQFKGSPIADNVTEGRSLATGIYYLSYYAGGAAGAWVAGLAFEGWHWPGSVLSIILFQLLAAAITFTFLQPQARTVREHP